MLITYRADRMSGIEFLDAIGLSSPEKRSAAAALMQEQCIRAIESGNTYGWPPLMVAECQKIIEERARLTECRPDPLPHLEPKSRAA
jgi:hypothetical protein